MLTPPYRFIIVYESSSTLSNTLALSLLDSLRGHSLGFPVVAQWKSTRLVSVRTRVQSLASVNLSEIGHIAVSYGIGNRHNLDLMLLSLWHRWAAATPFPPLAWELLLVWFIAHSKTFLNDYFFYYSWFTVFCQFSTVLQNYPVSLSHTHTHIHIYSLSHIILHYAPSQVTKYISPC